MLPRPAIACLSSPLTCDGEVATLWRLIIEELLNTKLAIPAGGGRQPLILRRRDKPRRYPIGGQTLCRGGLYAPPTQRL